MRTHRRLKIAAIALAAIAAFMVIVNVIPPKRNVENNPFIVGEGSLPMIAAHRGGSECNPENTMLAFREAVNTYDVEIIESDVYLTKDSQLVFNHNAYIDETCNVNGDISPDEVKELCRDEAKRHYIKDMTLEEIESYNFGYYFEDENGERIYKDVADPQAMGLQIATVDRLFGEFHETHPELLFIIEIKNSGELGKQACKVLDEELSAYPEYRDRIVIGTFHNEIEQELREKYPKLLRGASTGSAVKFVLTSLFGVNLFDQSDFACLQIPTTRKLGITLKLDKPAIVNASHRRNVALQYWTINDADEMRRLIELGCDCIMTDNPRLLREVLEEYK